MTTNREEYEAVLVEGRQWLESDLPTAERILTEQIVDLYEKMLDSDDENIREFFDAEWVEQ